MVSHLFNLQRAYAVHFFVVLLVFQHILAAVLTTGIPLFTLDPVFDARRFQAFTSR